METLSLSGRNLINQSLELMERVRIKGMISQLIKLTYERELRRTVVVIPFGMGWVQLKTILTSSSIRFVSVLLLVGENAIIRPSPNTLTCKIGRS